MLDSPFIHVFCFCCSVDHVDSDEAKAFFEANYSHIFYILHETFVQAEANLKQRGEFIYLSLNGSSIDVTRLLIQHSILLLRFFFLLLQFTKELSFHLGKLEVGTCVRLCFSFSVAFLFPCFKPLCGVCCLSDCAIALL